MSLTKFILIICHIPIFYISINLLFKFSQFRHEIKPVATYLILTGILFAISLVLWFYNINNLIILHILVPLRFLLLITIYNKIFSGYLPKWIMQIVAVIFCIFSIVNTFLFETYDTFNSSALTIEGVVMIILSLSTYLFLIDKRMTKHLKDFKRSIEWVNSGVFIYYTTTLTVSYFGKFIIELLSPELSRYTWMVNSILIIIMHYCFYIAIWKQKNISHS